ncbi:hypothetical protein HNY73_022925 [Argiope bruennichi]|uniref:Uncharacterized protein n=1 Tax=Argiope bruennichi TaxID=94029 RepID=A0A8T0E390_ARGBR|nr:hypothetical protein HNY73_022925 [Argiope bruennichi]
MLQASARQPIVAKELNMPRTSIHRLRNHNRRDQNTCRRRVWTPENDHIVRRSLPVAMYQKLEDTTNKATVGIAALSCCRKAHSCQTVSCRLHDGGLFALRAVACEHLSPVLRLQVSRKYLKLIVEIQAHCFPDDYSEEFKTFIFKDDFPIKILI